MSDFPTRHPYTLGLWQKRIEQIMAAWIAELPVRIYYGSEVTGFAQDDAGVTLRAPTAAVAGAVSGRLRRRAQRGAQSAGLDFPGWDAPGAT